MVRVLGNAVPAPIRVERIEPHSDLNHEFPARRRCYEEGGNASELKARSWLLGQSR